MGLTAVLNDTPEKRRSREKLLALFDKESFGLSPSMWADNGFASIMLHAQTAFGDDNERLAKACSTKEHPITAQDVEGWAAGMEPEMPELARQATIVGLLRSELLRAQAAVDHD